MSTEELIRTAASFLSVAPERIVNFRSDPGGLNNRTYRFESDGVPYFLRVPTPASRLFSSYANEIAICNALRGTGIANRVVRIDPDTGIKLSFAETDVRTMNPLSGEEIARALTALRRLHHLSVPMLSKETLFERTRRFAGIVSAKKIAIDAETQDQLEKLWKLEPLLNDRPRVPVHGDLLPENVLIFSDGRAILIDFEFAALGDPLEDLGSLYCHLPPESISPDFCLKTYLNRAPTETETHLIFVYATLTALGWRLWARLKIHENENVRDIGAYNRLMIDYTTNHQLPAIPGPIASRENRS